MAKIVVLGAGMVGRTIAATLSKTHEVLVLDINRASLKSIQSKTIRIKVCDLTDPVQLTSTIAKADLVLGAIPGHLGYQMLKTVILAGKNIVDISFFPEDAATLNKLAKEKRVIAMHDCGVAPGMDNILLGFHDSRMKVTHFKCMVGGLPKKKNPPFNYKAPFSPIDVLEEYTRPARIKIKGKVVIKPALTDMESFNVPGIGKLEAFNSDGLRSLIKTMPHIPNMVEKTIRYPGHAAQMEWIREAGFLSKHTILRQGQQIRPLDITTQLLFPHWTYLPGEQDFTYMVVIIEGRENGQKIRYTYTLNDQYHRRSQTSSMARTTGLTACAVAEMILAGMFKKTGVHPPETLGSSTLWVNHILQYLQDRGVIYHLKRSIL